MGTAASLLPSEYATWPKPLAYPSIAHGGMNYTYGQHLSFAMPAIAWGERSERVSPPGVPLEEMPYYRARRALKMAIWCPATRQASVSK